jgi:hypothetical protein
MAKTKPKGRPVILTTLHRGVFFGYAATTAGWAKDGATVKLARGRSVVYWSADCHGFMGLAANGPTASCKIGPACDIEVKNVTAVLDVPAPAAKKFEEAPWPK